MRKIVCSFLLCLPVITHAAMLLEYTFDRATAKQAVDTSGHRLNGRFVGQGVSIGLVPPGHGNTLRLSGKASYVDAGTPPVLNLAAAYTLMGWMRYSNTAERAAELLYKGGMYWINVNLQSPRAAENHHALAGGLMGLVRFEANAGKGGAVCQR